MWYIVVTSFVCYTITRSKRLYQCINREQGGGGSYASGNTIPALLSSPFPSDCVFAAEDSVGFSAGAAPKVNDGASVGNLVGLEEDGLVGIMGVLLAGAPNKNGADFVTPGADPGTVSVGVALVTAGAAADIPSACDGTAASESIWIWTIV